MPGLSGRRCGYMLTSNRPLTPVLLLAPIINHAADATRCFLVILLAAVMDLAEGLYSLLGVTTSFTDVSGDSRGFCARFLPSSLDLLLQRLRQSAAL